MLRTWSKSGRFCGLLISVGLFAFGIYPYVRGTSGFVGILPRFLESKQSGVVGERDEIANRGSEVWNQVPQFWCFVLDDQWRRDFAAGNKESGGPRTSITKRQFGVSKAGKFGLV